MNLRLIIHSSSSSKEAGRPVNDFARFARSSFGSSSSDNAVVVEKPSRSECLLVADGASFLLFRVLIVFLGNDSRLLIPHRHPMNGVSTTLLTSSFSEGRGKTLGQVGVQLTDQPGQRRTAVEGLFNLAAGMQDCAVIASAEVGSDLLQRQRR